MPKYLIEMADATTHVLRAAGYRDSDGYLHFSDELGDAVYCVSTRDVAGVERLPTSDEAPTTAGQPGGPAPDTDASVLLIRFWPESDHSESLRFRITSSHGTHSETATTYAHTRHDVLTSVRAWLNAVGTRPSFMGSDNSKPREPADPTRSKRLT